MKQAEHHSTIRKEKLYLISNGCKLKAAMDRNSKRFVMLIGSGRNICVLKKKHSFSIKSAIKQHFKNPKEAKLALEQILELTKNAEQQIRFD